MTPSKHNAPIDKVSASFCLAKWFQVTWHFQNGHTQSCHHVKSHRVDSRTLADDPTTLHNTREKLAARRQMIEGERPTECSYCWRMEDAGGVSDRYLKSASEWASPHLEVAKQSSFKQTVAPTYVELAFDNICNFKCMYCSPIYSTSWALEIDKHGPYPTSMKFQSRENIDYREAAPLPEHQRQAYVTAFWKWWPQLSMSLQHLRVTGGEPLLSKETWRLIEHLITEPKPQIEFAINSNLSASPDLLRRLIDKINQLEGKVKSFTLYISLDCVGAPAEYIRDGLNYQNFLNNVNQLLKGVRWPITISYMVSVNALSLPGLKDLVTVILEQRQSTKIHRLAMDFPYLANPPHMSIEILPRSWVHYVYEALGFMKSHHNPCGFNNHEIGLVERLATLMSNNRRPWPRLWRLRADFYRMYCEYDRRRGRDFLSTFPAYQWFWRQCQAIAWITHWTLPLGRMAQHCLPWTWTRRLRWLVLFVVMMTSLKAHAFSEDTPLTLQAAVDLALSANPSLASNREKVTQTQSAIPLARSTLFPTLSLTASDYRKRDITVLGPGAWAGSPYTLYGTALNLTQPLFQMGLFSAIHAARNDVRQSELNAHISQRDLVSSVIQAFYQVGYTNKNVETLLQQQAIAEDTVEVTIHRQRIGRAQLLDSLQAKTQLALVTGQLLTMQNALQVARANLLNLLGERAKGQNLQVTGSLEPPPLEVVDQRFQSFKDNIPEVEVAALAIDRIDDQRSVLRGQYLPTLNLIGTYGYSTYNQYDLFENSANVWSVGLLLTIPLYPGLAFRAQNQALLSQQRQLRFNKQFTENQVSYQQVTSRKNLESAFDTIQTGFEGLRLATASSKEAKRNFSLGTIDFLQYLSVQQAQVTAEQALNASKYNYIVALTTYLAAHDQELSSLVSFLMDSQGP